MGRSWKTIDPCRNKGTRASDWSLLGEKVYSPAPLCESTCLRTNGWPGNHRSGLWLIAGASGEDEDTRRKKRRFFCVRLLERHPPSPRGGIHRLDFHVFVRLLDGIIILLSARNLTIPAEFLHSALCYTEK